MSPQLQSLNPAPSLAPPIGAAGDEPKRTAAAMADKLASLSAPVQVLSSIFSSFVATHGASLSSMNSGSPPRDQLSGAPPGFQVEKRPRLERTVLASDMGAPPFSVQAPRLQQPVGAMPTQAAAQMNQAPGPFAPPPPPPPLPPLLPPLLQQFGQSAGGMMGMGPFAMMAGSMPPPPPMSSIMPAGFPAPSGPPPPPLPPAQTQPQQQQQHQSPPQPPAPQQSAGFFQPSAGMGYFPAMQVQQSPSAQRQ
jgi:regulator of Ty1 transposition protein 103